MVLRTPEKWVSRSIFLFQIWYFFWFYYYLKFMKACSKIKSALTKVVFQQLEKNIFFIAKISHCFLLPFWKKISTFDWSIFFILKFWEIWFVLVVCLWCWMVVAWTLVVIMVVHLCVCIHLFAFVCICLHLFELIFLFAFVCLH